MVKLNDALETRFVSVEDFQRLEKAFQMQKGMDTTSTADPLINIEYDTELQNLVYQQSPFLRYCEGAGIITPAKSSKVGVRTKNKQTVSSWTGEEEPIPDFNATAFDNKVTNMKQLLYPIEISDLAQKGVDAADLLKEELSDGYIDIATSKDKCMLQGDGGDGKKDFTGLITSTKTNVHNNTDAVLDLDTVDSVAQDVIDAGGSPSAIVTTAKVYTQLKNMVESKQRFMDTVELEVGVNVKGYNAPNAQTIPIIVDPNINTSIEGHVLQFVDKRSYKVRELQPPTIKELAPTKMAASKVIYTWITGYNRNEKWGGKITNIGDKE